MVFAHMHSATRSRFVRMQVLYFTRPATLPHPPRTGLLLARLLFTAALLGPLTTTPAYFADLARLNSSADRYGNPCPDCSNIRPAISPGYVGSPFGALPFTKRPPRLFMCLLALCRLGCSLHPFGLFTRPDPAPPRIGSAAPGHNPARGPFHKPRFWSSRFLGRSCESRPARPGWVVGAPFGSRRPAYSRPAQIGL